MSTSRKLAQPSGKRGSGNKEGKISWKNSCSEILYKLSSWKICWIMGFHCKCFPVNFGKKISKTYSQNTTGWLLLRMVSHKVTSKIKDINRARPELYNIVGKIKQTEEYFLCWFSVVVARKCSWAHIIRNFMGLNAQITGNFDLSELDISFLFYLALSGFRVVVIFFYCLQSLVHVSFRSHIWFRSYKKF